MIGARFVVWALTVGGCLLLLTAAGVLGAMQRQGPEPSCDGASPASSQWCRAFAAVAPLPGLTLLSGAALAWAAAATAVLLRRWRVGPQPS